MPNYSSYLPTRRYQPSGLALSPDGTEVAYSCDAAGGQFNLWRHPVAGGEPVQLTHFTDHSVREIAWAPDGQSIVFTADRHGDEFHQIYRVTLDGGEPEALTDAPAAQHYLGLDPFSPDGRYLAYGANDAEPTRRDVLVMSLRSGRVRRVHTPRTHPSLPVLFTPAGSALVVTEQSSNTNTDLYLVSLDGEPVRHLTPHEGHARHTPVGWTPDGGSFWMVTDACRDLPALGRYDMRAGTTELVDAPDREVSSVVVSADRTVVCWVVNDGGYSRLRARRADTGREIAVPELPAGVIITLRVSAAGRRLVALLSTPTRPPDIAVIDLVEGRFSYLTDARPPTVDPASMIEPELVAFPTHDGREIPAFCYRPAGEGRFPVVLSIHGGPEGQELPAYAYGGLYQYLLANGIGVLAPNVRGSTGYGRAYQRLIHRDWGGAELGDFEHAVRYLHALDWVDAERIGVFGGSFGGFATLSCVSRLPDLFAAAVSIVGPSNLVTFARAVPPTWRSLMAEWVGDPETETEFLMARSPISHADRIRAPLFVIQGANDPRVVRAESDQIVERLRARGVEVRYDVYEDEGHGFTKKVNMARAFGDTAEFLIARLGTAAPHAPASG